MKLRQLSLRELFLLVVIAALGCGWLVDRSRLIIRYKNLIHYVEKEGAEVGFVEGGHRVFWNR